MSNHQSNPVNTELIARRRKLCDLICAAAHTPSTDSVTACWAPQGKEKFSHSLIIVRGAPPSLGIFRQSNEMFYLTALEIPNAYLEIDTRDAHSIIYLPHRNKSVESGAEPRLSADDVDAVRALTGVDEVQPLETLPETLGRRIKRRLAPLVYIPLAPAEGLLGTRDGLLDAAAEELVDPWSSSNSREYALAVALRAKFPTLDIRDASPFLDQMRAIKSPAEIALMREAGRLSGLATLEAMRSTKAGVMEYELAAVANFIYMRGGAFGSAYEPIVATGKNIWFGHYSAKSTVLTQGQLVLMDSAPDYRYYTSDIGRMWPVNGAWDPWQLELYGFIARYHQELLRHIRPGVTNEEVLTSAAATMLEILTGTTFSKPAYERAARQSLDFPYHLSHPVGMSVHDVGEYRGAPFIVGQVFSVDPMLWVPEEYLYIRCEDTVVVTETGIENFTGFVPINPDEITAVMAQPGLLQIFS